MEKCAVFSEFDPLRLQDTVNKWLKMHDGDITIVQRLFSTSAHSSFNYSIVIFFTENK